MAEEEVKSSGSGFGKLVYGTLKGNGINTEGMSFEEAVKKFNELGGTDNWHAKIMKREADEKQAKESAKKSSIDGKIEEYQKKGMSKQEAMKKVYNELPESQRGNFDTVYGTKNGESEKEEGARYEVKDQVNGSVVYTTDDRMDALKKMKEKGERYQVSDTQKEYDTTYYAQVDKALKEQDEIDYNRRLMSKEPLSNEDKKRFYNELNDASSLNKPREEKKSPSKKSSVNDKINAKATADEIINNPNSSEFEKNLYKGAKEEINKNTKKFMEDAKAGKIKPEVDIPKGLKWNSNTNSYEYKGASVMQSMIDKDLYEVNIDGDDVVVPSLYDAKRVIDSRNDTTPGHYNPYRAPKHEPNKKLGELKVGDVFYDPTYHEENCKVTRVTKDGAYYTTPTSHGAEFFSPKAKPVAVKIKK